MHRDVAICNGAITVLGSISMACCDLYCPDLCKYVRVCVCAYVCDFFSGSYLAGKGCTAGEREAAFRRLAGPHRLG